jgi:hypothetical protein
MHRTPLITTRRISPFEGFAWYWLWSGTLCLWLVPAAREISLRFGWVPYWLVGAPLALLVVNFLLSWARRWAVPRSSRPHSLDKAALLMTPADVAAVAQRLRPMAAAPGPVERVRAPRRRRLATVALLSR